MKINQIPMGFSKNMPEKKIQLNQHFKYKFYLDKSYLLFIVNQP